MSKFNTFLAVIGMVFLALAANAQITFTFVPSDAMPDEGETITVDAVVTGFTDIASYQYSINWNENLMMYQGVSNFNLVGLSAGNFGTTNAANGVITTSWSDPSASAQSLPNGTVLFTMTFDITSSAGTTTEIEFSQTPLGFEIIQEEPGGALNDVTGSTTFNNALIEVNGGGDPGTGGVVPCSFSGFGITITSDSAATGEQVCLNVGVCNFTDIVSIQHTIQFDPTLLQFDEVNSFNLENLDGGAFGTTNAGNGLIAFSWLDSLVDGLTVPDETIIYSICFTAIGAGGNADSIKINGALLSEEVTDVNDDEIGLESIDGEITITGSSGSAVTLVASQEQGNPGDTVTVDISVRNFDSIASFQASMLWDPDIIRFFEVNDAGNLPGTIDFNTSAALVNTGKLAFNWADPGTTGQPLPDDEILFSIRYIIDGEVAEVSAVDFTDDPLATEVSQAQDGTLEIVPLAKIPGLVEVVGQGLLTLTIGDVMGAQGDTVCVPVTVTNFNNVVSLEYTVEWNAVELQYIRAEDFNLSGLGVANFNAASGNNLKLSWFEPLLNPQTLADGSTIYSMCFEILAPNGSNIDITFDEMSTIEITDGNNPIAYTLEDGSIAVGGVQPMSVSDTTITNVLCNGDATGAIALTVVDNAAAVNYTWSNGAGNSASINGLTAGNYTATITDGVTTLIQTYTVTEPSALTESTSVENVSCNGEDDGSITVTPGGGTAPYTYAWSNGGTNATIAGLAPGTYTVTVSDANMCTITASETITEPAVLTIAMSAQDVTTNGGNDGEATATPSGGTGPYTYTWNPGGGSTMTITGLIANTYNVTVTDARMCTATDFVVVDEPGAVSATISGTDVTCNGDDDGTATVVPSGGVGPYNYTWNPSVGTTATVSDLPAGTYFVTVEDANNATTVVDITINEPVVLDAAVTDTNVSCNGGNDGTATVTPSGGNGGNTFLWSNGGTSATISNLIAGQYTVTVTDSEGCTDEGTTFVSEPDELTVSGNVTHESGPGANDGAITVMPSGGTTSYDYAWNPNVGNTATISSLSPGNYTVTVTDAQDCETSETFTVNQFDAPQITVESITLVNCNGESTGAIDISVNGGLAPYDYDWGGGVTTEDRNNIPAGNYTVTVTDDIGTTAVETVTVTESSAIVIVVDGQDNVGCNGESTGAINISVSGGNGAYTYNWGGGITDQDPTNLAAGTYMPTITDGTGCVQVGPTVIITEPNGITISVVSSVNVSCNGEATGAINIDVTGGVGPYTYNWGGGITTQDPTGLPAGNYTVTITDANDCIATGPMITISEPPALSASSSSTSISCNGANDGTITLNVSGGVPGYSYSWNPALPNQANHTGVAAGSYSVTITDALGCTIVEGPIAVTQPAPLSLSNTTTNASSANDDGAINLTVTGGTPAYTYNWSNGTSTEDQNGLASGCYGVTVSDANGCIVEDSIKVGGVIVITDIITDVSCAGSCDGAIDIDILGGIAPYTYTWAGTGVVTGAEDQSNLCAGIYNVTVADSNGSLTSGTFTVGTPTALTVTNVDVQNETGTGCNGAINITVTGGTLPYTYNWSNGETSKDITDLCKGDYDVTITDANGCIILQNDITVAPPPLVVANSEATMASCNGSSDGRICLSVLGGCAPYTLTLDGNQQTSVSGEDICYDNLPVGSYSIVIQDAGNPQMVLVFPFDIAEPDPVSIDIVSISNPTDAINCDGTIDIEVSGGTGAYSYLWNTGATIPDPTNLCPSPPLYSVTVTDVNGCTGTVGGIELDLGLSISVASKEDVSCIDACDGSIDVDVLGGTSPYTYIWGPTGQTTSTINNLCAGTYDVTVTDAEGVTATQTIIIDAPANAWTVEVASTEMPSADNANGSISLDVSGGWGFESVNWAGPDGFTGNTLTIGGLVEGFYTATVEDQNGCIEVITVELSANRLNLSFEVMTPTCNGDADGDIEVLVDGNGSGDYTIEWSTGATTSSIFGLAAGTYSVTVTDNVIAGLSISAVIELTQPDVLGITLNATNPTGPANGEIEAEVTGGTVGTDDYTYVWNTVTAEETPRVTRLSAGIYMVIVTDDNGCTAIAQTELTPQGECLEARKVISPNNDGSNDELIISCVEALNNNLKIFNRWGEMVYEADNYDNTWTGTDFDGKLLPESGYFWVLEYEEDGQTKQLKGSFTLLRGEN